MSVYWKSAILVLACIIAIPALAQFGGPKDIIAVSVVSEQTGVKPGADLRVAVVAAIKEPYHVNANKPLEQFLIPTALTLEPPQGITVMELVYPEAENKSFSFSPDKPVAVYEGEVPIGVVLRVDASVAPGPVTVPGKLRYQACNDTQCLAPTTVAADIAITVLGPGDTAAPSDSDVFARIAFGSGAQPAEAAQKPTGERAAVVSESSIDPKDLLSAFSIAGQTGGYLNAQEFIEFIDASERGEGFSQSTFFAGRSLVAIVLLTLVGGLALNLTPCVLPLIPINLAIIGAGAKAGSRAKGFALGGLYGLGIALVYGVLGLIAVLGAGTFGTINASPWFNFAIAIIFVVLALAMFDILLIDFSKFQSKLGIKKEKGSFIFAFLMGSVNALLAGACVAPVVIAVILYAQDAYAGGSPAGLALPFLLGVGMALPWPFAGAGLALLPKPGLWMVRVKQAFGVFILGFAAYYGYLGYTLFSERYLVDPAAVTASAENLAEEGWLTSLEEGLAQAKRESKPVLIDFWATWCKNCLVMNETTFQDPAVLERLKDFVKIKYQAEQPEEAPAKDVLAQFEYVGLPLYVVLKP